MTFVLLNSLNSEVVPLHRDLFEPSFSRPPSLLLSLPPPCPGQLSLPIPLLYSYSLPPPCDPLPAAISSSPPVLPSRSSPASPTRPPGIAPSPSPLPGAERSEAITVSRGCGESLSAAIVNWNEGKWTDSPSDPGLGKEGRLRDPAREGAPVNMRFRLSCDCCLRLRGRILQLLKIQHGHYWLGTQAVTPGSRRADARAQWSDRAAEGKGSV